MSHSEKGAYLTKGQFFCDTWYMYQVCILSMISNEKYLIPNTKAIELGGDVNENGQ